MTSSKKKVIKFSALPENPSKKERSIFDRFKSIIMPELYKQREMVERYEEAKVRKEEGEANILSIKAVKLLNEADLIAKEASHREKEAKKIEEELETVRLENLVKKFDIIDNHFSNLSEDDKTALKLSQLGDPQKIIDQMNKVKMIQDKLYSEKGTIISLKSEYISDEEAKEDK